MIKRLEELHDCGILHRDIKPENFCLGGEEMREVYLIDFGLSCAYIEEDGSHKSFSKNSGFVGTPRYASRFAHQGFTQGRRDDLEAVGYMCIFLIKGKLPW
jgi:serine/threonine protein kinase